MPRHEDACKERQDKLATQYAEAPGDLHEAEQLAGESAGERRREEGQISSSKPVPQASILARKFTRLGFGLAMGDPLDRHPLRSSYRGTCKLAHYAVALPLPLVADAFCGVAESGLKMWCRIGLFRLPRE